MVEAKGKGLLQTYWLVGDSAHNAAIRTCSIAMVMYTHTHTHTHKHACIHTYVHTYIHTHTYTYIHIYFLLSEFLTWRVSGRWMNLIGFREYILHTHTHIYIFTFCFQNFWLREYFAGGRIPSGLGFRPDIYIHICIFAFCFQNFWLREFLAGRWIWSNFYRACARCGDAVSGFTGCFCVSATYTSRINTTIASSA